MKKYNIDGIIKRCDQLTSNDEELSVSWTGGGDEGYFDIDVDGESIDTDGPLDELIKIVEDVTEHWSFNGSYYANGALTYNKADKTLCGSDTASSTETDILVAHTVLQVPKSVWFDKLEILIEAEDSDTVSCLASLTIYNGPKTDMHMEIQHALSLQLVDYAKKAIARVQDFEYLTQEYAFSFSEFADNGSNWQIEIEKIEYCYTQYENSEILIDLNDLRKNI